MTTMVPSMSSRRFLKWLNLSFADKALEREFIEYYVQGALRVSQILMLIGAFAYYSTFISDYTMDPPTGHENHIIRGIFAFPVMISCTAIFFWKKTHKFYEIIVTVYYIIPCITSCYIYSNMNIGFEHSTLGFILLLMAANLTFTVRLKYTLFISIFALSAMIFSYIYADNASSGWLYISLKYLLTAVLFSSISAHLREGNARTRFLTERAIVDSQARNDDLLYAMMPRNVAQRVQAGETNIADSLGEVTIIFANITGVRDPNKTLRLSDRVRGLNQLFSAFDVEAERYNVEKIKTMDGCYMAIAGLSPKNTTSDHTEDTANFALAVRAIMKKWGHSLGISVNFRIGIHVGPIVAGIIGVQRLRFDCWGDSVNIASRLESSAENGNIYISESTYWRLKQKFLIESVGDIELKGVGNTAAYRLGNRFDEKTFISFLEKHSLAQKAT